MVIRCQKAFCTVTFVMIYCCSVILSPILSNKKQADKIEKSRINTDFFSILSNKKLFLGSIGTHGSGVRPMQDYMLWVRFNTGEERVYDCKPLLSRSGFAALKDTEVCNSVYIDYGVTVWCDGEIDISPNELYTNGAKADKDIA